MRVNIKMKYDREDFSYIVLLASRYSYLRKTYMPGVTCDFIRDNYIHISQDVLATIVKDIDEITLEKVSFQDIWYTWHNLKSYIISQSKDKTICDNNSFIDVVDDDYMNHFSLVIMAAIRYSLDNKLDTTILKTFISSNIDVVSTHMLQVTERDIRESLLGKGIFSYYLNDDASYSLEWKKLYKLILDEVNKRNLDKWEYTGEDVDLSDI